MVVVPVELSPEHVASLGRDVLAAMPGGVVHVRADGSIAAANAEACSFLGFAYDELTRRYTVDFEPQTIWEDGGPCAAVEYPVSRALATGLPQPAVTIGVRRPDGALRWAVFRATPIKDAVTRQTLGAIVTFLDVTEQKQIEEELRGSRELLRKSQALAKIGSVRWDLKGGELSWSHDMWKVGGARAEGTAADIAAALAFVHEDDRDRMSRLAESVLSGSSMLGPTEARVHKLDGSEAVLWIWAEIVLDGSGRPQHVDVAVQDVTERRRLEEHLRRAQRMETVGRLASGVAHDFNNLLQVILANVEVGRRSLDGQSSLQRIEVAARRAAELTRQLLTLGSRQPFRRESVSASESMRALLELLPAVLVEGITIEHELAEGLPTIGADPGLLQQALLNVCINARDAMPDGGTLCLRVYETREVPVGAVHDIDPASAAASYLAFEITDTGHGIPPAVQARMFEPFFTTKQAGRGSGLGLAVVHGIVQQHGGVLHVQSSSAGTTIALLLPVCADDAERLGGAGRAASVMPEPLTAKDPRPPCVLLVEDEVSVQRAVAHVLQDEGYAVLCADDGFRAERIFTEHADRIDVLLTDIDMPRMSGLELASKLRKGRNELRVIFTTGDAAAAASIPSESVLCKPFEMQELLDVVQKAVVGRARSSTR